MATITFNWRVVALMTFIFLTHNLFPQGSIYEVPLEKQAELSTQIVEGEVISKASFWDNFNKNIYTSYTVKVYKVFKGKSYNVIEVITEGGTVDLEAQVVSHSLQLQRGDLGTFMLSNFNNNTLTGKVNYPTYKSVSALQGFYKYSLKNNKVVNAFNVINGITNSFYDKLLQNTQTNIIEIEAYDVQQKVSQLNNTFNRVSTASILSFSTSGASAGTKSVLTISGSNFGTTQGTVGFSNANYGGAIHSDALDSQVLSWTNSNIEVEIPDIAGTGTIKVNTISSGTIESSENLIIGFAQINLETNIGSGDEAFQTQHVDMNTNGGYTWTMNANFNSNQNAKDAFNRAFENWTCGTGVNWEVDDSNTTTISSASKDDVNVIAFDSGLSSGVLGRCISYYKGCFVDGELKFYVEEMDIVFNPNRTWNYSTNNPITGESDFESAAVHELGHGHQLGHVIDNNEVMNYSLTTGTAKRDLSGEDLSGGTDVQSRSTTIQICSKDLMTDSSCARLSNTDFELLNQIKMYPNPSQGQFFIKNNTQVTINKIQVYNILGQEVYNNLNLNSRLTTINLNYQSKGLYLVKLETDYGSFTRKLMIR